MPAHFPVHRTYVVCDLLVISKKSPTNHKNTHSQGVILLKSKMFLLLVSFVLPWCARPAVFLCPHQLKALTVKFGPVWPEKLPGHVSGTWSRYCCCLFWWFPKNHQHITNTHTAKEWFCGNHLLLLLFSLVLLLFSFVLLLFVLLFPLTSSVKGFNF